MKDYQQIVDTISSYTDQIYEHHSNKDNDKVNDVFCDLMEYMMTELSDPIESDDEYSQIGYIFDNTFNLNKWRDIPPSLLEPCIVVAVMRQVNYH